MSRSQAKKITVSFDTTPVEDDYIIQSMLADQKQAQALEEQTLIRVLMQMIGKISKRSEGANNV